MALEYLQAALMRLYTDSALFARLTGKPLPPAGTLDLLDEDARELAARAPERLHYFADAILRERLHNIRQLLPATARLLGDDFDAQFLLRAPNWHFHAAHRPFRDALALSRELRRMGRLGEGQPAWVQDVLRYESAWLVAGAARRGVWARWFRHDLEVILPTLQWRSDPPGRTRRWMIGLWFKPRPSGAVRHRMISFW